MFKLKPKAWKEVTNLFQQDVNSVLVEIQEKMKELDHTNDPNKEDTKLFYAQKILKTWYRKHNF